MLINRLWLAMVCMANLTLFSCASAQDHEGNETEESECGFEDGIYSALVYYSNPRTGANARYTLEVEVRDCQVVEIDFPTGGYLDDDHIDAADLESNGRATVHGEAGKKYEVYVDN